VSHSATLITPSIKDKVSKTTAVFLKLSIICKPLIF
jgi:hypothetical protein